MPTHTDEASVLKEFATKANVNVVVHGSRQLGTSFHTGLPFRATSDLDIGVIGQGTDAMRALLSPSFNGLFEKIPNLDFNLIIPTAKDALDKGLLIIRK